MAKAKESKPAAREATVVVRNVARRPLIFRVADGTVRLGPRERREIPKRWCASVELKRFCRDRCVVFSEEPRPAPGRQETAERGGKTESAAERPAAGEPKAGPPAGESRKRPR